MEKDNIAKLLGLEDYKNVDWPEIYAEIGRLQERGRKADWFPSNPYYQTSPITMEPRTEPYHMHDNLKCYKNPCVWC